MSSIYISMHFIFSSNSNILSTVIFVWFNYQISCSIYLILSCSALLLPKLNFFIIWFKYCSRRLLPLRKYFEITFINIPWYVLSIFGNYYLSALNFHSLILTFSNMHFSGFMLKFKSRFLVLQYFWKESIYNFVRALYFSTIFFSCWINSSTVWTNF